MPSLESIHGPLKNATFDLYFSLKKPSPAGVGDEDAFLTNPTLATGDIKISKDGGSFANVGTLGATAPASGDIVKQSFTATEMNAAVIVVMVKDQTGTEEWQAHCAVLYTSNHVRSTTPANTLAVDSSGRVDVGAMLGSAVTLSGGNNLDVNVDEVSDDATAAINLENYCDGTTPIPANATQISGDSTAADNLESYCDGDDNMQVHVVEFTSTFDFSSTMKTSIGTACQSELNRAIGASPTADSVNQRVKALDVLLETGGTGDALAIYNAVITGGVQVDMSQAVSESPTSLTVGYAFYSSIAAATHKQAISSTTLTLYKSDGSTTFVSRTLDLATNATSITP